MMGIGPGTSLGFGAPWYLLLLGLLPLVFWGALGRRTDLTRARRVVSIALRSTVVALVVLALAETQCLKRNDRLAVFFALDRSESISADRQRAARDYVLEAARGRKTGDLAGVIAFGRLAGIETPARVSDPDLESFVTLIEPDATNISAAIRLASAAFPARCGKRIVLLSDGNENRESVLDEVRFARSLGVTVDVVPVDSSPSSEMMVQKLLVDAEVREGQPFDIRVVVRSTKDAQAYLRLYEDGALISRAGSMIDLHPGKNVMEFRARRLEQAGRHTYEARLEPVRMEDDEVPENNVGFGLTMIRGEPRVLLCSAEPELDGPILAALAAEKIRVQTVRPQFLPTETEAYLEYEAIILSNVGAQEIPDERMTLFESLVKTVGTGFIMIGGEDSFGAGGYQGTPVERLLPVRMQVPERRELPNGALAMVVHSCELDRGNWWARQVIQKSLRILSPRDYAGVLYYGMSGEQWLFPMTPVTQRRRMLSLLRSFTPGDMPDFNRILQLALKGLQAAPASIRHAIVLSDGDPQLPAQALVNKFRAARITISTICYGNHGSPALWANMQRLARAGGGKAYYLKGPNNLPQIFLREVRKVQRSLISEEPFQPVLAASGSILKGLAAAEFPPLDGYVLTTPKELATVYLLHPPGKKDPTMDPVLATWTYGIGKSVAFTSDAGRRWGKRWAAWSGYQRFWSQCVRWVSRPRDSEGFRVTRRLEGDRAWVALDAVTADGRLLNGLSFDGHFIAPDGESHATEVRQTSPGRYEAEFPADRSGTYTVVLASEKDGRPVSTFTSISVPYSPEYRTLQGNTELLRQVAAAGKGRYIEDPEAALNENLFFSRDFPPSRDVNGIWRELLMAAVILFFLDVFVRRVVVDYLAVMTAAAGRILRLLGSRRVAPVPADARLSTLLERKEALRRQGAALHQEPERPAPGSPASSPAASTGTVAPFVSAQRQAEREDASGEPDAGPETSSREEGRRSRAAGEAAGTFTSRLLEAKRRALPRAGGDREAGGEEERDKPANQQDD